MITRNGYSKDSSIIPDGIAVTFGKDMIEEQGGLLCFLRNFEKVMANEGDYWMHKCKNKPQADTIAYVYIIISNRVYGRAQFGYHSTLWTIGSKANGDPIEVNWPYIVITGPLVKAPEKIIQKGFQGFRYTTMLF